MWWTIKFLGLTSHDDFLHFSAHFGMSFALYTILSRYIKYPTTIAFIIGLVYKLIEGPNGPNDFLMSMGRNLLGIAIAWRILK